MLSWVVRNKDKLKHFSLHLTPFFSPRLNVTTSFPTLPPPLSPSSTGEMGVAVSLQHCLSSSFLLKLFLCSSVHTLCGLQFLTQEPALAWAFHSCSVQAISISSIHQHGILHGLQCGYLFWCNPLQGLQGITCSTVISSKTSMGCRGISALVPGNTSSPLFSDLAVHGNDTFFPPMLFVFLDKFSKRCPKLCWSVQLSCSGPVTVPGTEAHPGSFSHGLPVQPPFTKSLPPVLNTATQRSRIIIHDLNTLMLPTNSNTPTTFWKVIDF